MHLSLDMSDVQRVAKNINAAEDQIPYAMMLALNEATKLTREHLIKVTWPGHIKQRNQSFIAAALITKGTRASKTNLSAEIYENPRLQGRGNLVAHAKGGVRVPHGRSHLAIPVSRIPRGARGIPARFKPKNMKGAKNDVRRGNLIYMRNRRGKLELVHVLKPSVRIPKRVPFYEDYQRVMSQNLNRLVPITLAKAMATRRR